MTLARSWPALIAVAALAAAPAANAHIRSGIVATDYRASVAPACSAFPSV